jgi:hypothetical protein
MPRFRDTSEFSPTLDAAAERLGISATAVEKDYWVSEVLRVLAKDFTDDFIFKGGTSLSKGYRIIERFSEDVDILVLPGERGIGTTDKLMKHMATVAAEGVGGEASSVGGAEKGRHRSYEISYPAIRASTEFIRTAVLLEMGVRGGAHPCDSVMISCLLGDVLESAGTDLSEFEDLEPFVIKVLHPGRTLLEKLVLVQTDARKLNAEASLPPSHRSGRHFYDIYQLLGSDNVRAFLVQRTEVEAVLDDIAAVTGKYFGGGGENELRPSGGFAASIAFDPESDASSLLRETYDATMSELYFGSKPLPTWDEIFGRVYEMRDLL